MKHQPELLIDWIYRDTFREPRNPDLRQLLVSARRCVLSDEMAAFMHSLMVEIYAGGKSGKHWMRRLHRRLDDCRHFSRLPHRVTWVEYSLNAMLKQEIETNTSWGYSVDDDTIVQSKLGYPRRVGWLLTQHDRIETAFRADYFIGGLPANDRPRWARTNTSIVWCTDDEPLPEWPGDHIMDSRVIFFKDEKTKVGESQSEWATGVPGYERANVATLMHDRKSGPGTPEGRVKMMWAFLSTFNKVPIIGEAKVQPAHGFVARGRYHQYLEHKLVTVNIPGKAGLRKVARTVLALIRRRAHMVRGHWRDDWHLPKGNKSLWIAEHQRGDASLGFVTHDYAVTHAAEN